MAETVHPVHVVDYPEPEWTIGDRIRKCRELMDLEQDQFGALFKKPVSRSMISKWEKGKREPKLSQLREIEAFAPVPKGFLIRSKWSTPIDLRILPGGQSGPGKLGQMPLPLFARAADKK